MMSPVIVTEVRSRVFSINESRYACSPCRAWSSMGPAEGVAAQVGMGSCTNVRWTSASARSARATAWSMARSEKSEPSTGTMIKPNTRYSRLEDDRRLVTPCCRDKCVLGG